MHTPLPTHPWKRHPRTGQPLAALGYTKRGEIIWPQMGASPDDAAGGGSAGDTSQTQPPVQQGQGQPPQPQQQTGNTTQQGNSSGANDVASLPDWAQKEIGRLRDEAAKSRTTAKEHAAQEARASLAQEIGKALGLVQDDAPPDPAKLTEQLAAERERASDAIAEALEYRVYKVAARAGANADRLLDSRSFIDAVDNLDVDPNDSKAFAEAVKAEVEKALERDPGLRANPTVTRQGHDTNGATTNRQRPAGLGAAIAARLNNQ